VVQSRAPAFDPGLAKTSKSPKSKPKRHVMPLIKKGVLDFTDCIKNVVLLHVALSVLVLRD